MAGFYLTFCGSWQQRRALGPARPREVDRTRLWRGLVRLESPSVECPAKLWDALTSRKGAQF
jgi:hypothetical protein